MDVGVIPFHSTLTLGERFDTLPRPGNLGGQLETDMARAHMRRSALSVLRLIRVSCEPR